MKDKVKKEKREKSTFFSDFKKFISKGNILDLAIGMIIGSAFTTIVNSFVKGIVMPLLNLLNPKGVGDIFVGVGSKVQVPGDVASTIASDGQTYLTGEWYFKQYLNVSTFINAVLNFLIISLVLFTVARIIRKVSSKAEEHKMEIYNKLHQEELQAAKEKADKEALLAKEKADKEALEALQKVQKEEAYKEDQMKLLSEIRDLLKNNQTN
jgi:large conductance mechanosensitive channel